MARGTIITFAPLLPLWKKGTMKHGKILSAIFAAALLLPCLLMTACEKTKASPGRFTEYSFDYFDTVTTITGYAETEEEFKRITADILAELSEYHRLFTIYQRFDGTENLCTINELVDGAHRVVTVDPRIVDMLTYAKEMYERTDGRMNVAMGSVLSIWHDYRTEGLDEPWNAELPPMDKLTEAAEHTDIHDLIIDRENSTVFLADPKMKLDVGAVAKGYAVEMVARSLEEQSITGFVLNVGGNVRTVGTKDGGESWKAGVSNPEESEETPYVAYLSLAGESLVTSGSYQRYYTVNGKNYHHIIDSETLMPAEGFLSVSVVCGSSADGDALSTALFCMSVEEGRALVQSMDGVEALWILADGTQVESDGLGKYLAE